MKQLDSDLAFECADARRERLLRDAEATSGARDTARARDHRERPERADIE
jgi:hypothetical protein